MAAAAQVAESLSQVQPRIMQTSASQKPVSRALGADVRQGEEAAALAPQRGADSLLYLTWCPQHRSPAGAAGGCPAQGLAGHTCVLDWQERGCCSWEPWLFPSTAKGAGKNPAKCIVTKKWPFDKDKLEKKRRLSLFLNKK